MHKGSGWYIFFAEIHAGVKGCLSSDCQVTSLIIFHLVAMSRYIAKTLYGDDDEEVTSQSNSVEEPKLLGINPGSTEKVCINIGLGLACLMWSVDV